MLLFYTQILGCKKNVTASQVGRFRLMSHVEARNYRLKSFRSWSAYNSLVEAFEE